MESPQRDGSTQPYRRSVSGDQRGASFGQSPTVASPARGGSTGGNPASYSGQWYRNVTGSLTWENSQVAVVFVLFVTMRAMDRVFNKRVNDRMVNFQLMYVNIFWPIGVQIMTVMLCGAWVWYNRVKCGDKRYDSSFFFPSSPIASAGGAYPQWRLALFSFWDQLNAVITSLPSPFIFCP